ncbi:MAG: hypothetical protein ACOCTT_02910, partial [archaeon]
AKGEIKSKKRDVEKFKKKIKEYEKEELEPFEKRIKDREKLIRDYEIAEEQALNPNPAVIMNLTERQKKFYQQLKEGLSTERIAKESLKSKEVEPEKVSGVDYRKEKKDMSDSKSGYDYLRTKAGLGKPRGFIFEGGEFRGVRTDGKRISPEELKDKKSAGTSIITGSTPRDLDRTEVTKDFKPLKESAGKIQDIKRDISKATFFTAGSPMKITPLTKPQRKRKTLSTTSRPELISRRMRNDNFGRTRRQETFRERSIFGSSRKPKSRMKSSKVDVLLGGNNKFNSNSFFNMGVGNKKKKRNNFFLGG